MTSLSQVNIYLVLSIFTLLIPACTAGHVVSAKFSRRKISKLKLLLGVYLAITTVFLWMAALNLKPFVSTVSSVWFLITNLVVYSIGVAVFTSLKLMAPSIVRHLHRFVFFLSIFIYPIILAGFSNLTILCGAWLVSYLFCAFINRLLDGSDRPPNRSIWLSLSNENFLSDMLQFRSDFSLNCPGGHREDLEKFYPYFIMFCTVFTVASLVSNTGTSALSLDETLATVDGTSFIGIVNLKNELKYADDPVTKCEPKSNGEGLPDGRNSRQSSVEDVTRGLNVLRRKPASDNDPNLGPVQMREDARRAVDLLNTRNLVFLLLFFASIWILNRKGSNSSYADKWKQHMAELRAIHQESRQEIREQLKVQFAASLIVTEMWGHRSFYDIFSEIVREVMRDHDDGTSITPSQLLSLLNTRAASTLFVTKKI